MYTRPFFQESEISTSINDVNLKQPFEKSKDYIAINMSCDCFWIFGISLAYSWMKGEIHMGQARVGSNLLATPKNKLTKGGKKSKQRLMKLIHD